LGRYLPRTVAEARAISIIGGTGSWRCTSGSE